MGIDKEKMPKFKYFQIKKSFVKGETEKSMLSFIDISRKILYDTSKAESDLLSLINSTMSHEMRNPLNSIISQCGIMESILMEFEKVLDRLSFSIELKVIYGQLKKAI